MKGAVAQDRAIPPAAGVIETRESRSGRPRWSGHAAAKGVVDALARLVALPLVALWRFYRACTGRETLFVSLSQLLSVVPGRAGVYVRRAFYRGALSACGRNVNIGFGTFFSHAAVQIGDDVYIGSRCTIGLCRIGDGVMIGSNVDLLSGRRQHRRDAHDQLLDPGEDGFERIDVGAHAWVGNSAVVMASVGEGATVGAGSVVVAPVRSRATVVGNPARELTRS